MYEIYGNITLPILSPKSPVVIHATSGILLVLSVDWKEQQFWLQQSFPLLIDLLFSGAKRAAKC